jgi:hypothetical protein
MNNQMNGTFSHVEKLNVHKLLNSLGDRDFSLGSVNKSMNKTGSVLGVIHIFLKCVLVNFVFSVILAPLYCRYKLL